MLGIPQLGPSYLNHTGHSRESLTRSQQSNILVSIYIIKLNILVSIYIIKLNILVSIYCLFVTPFVQQGFPAESFRGHLSFHWFNAIY